jgi:CBS domain-containing protein
LLLQNQITGAPVVDAAGRCVGVLSASEFLRLIDKGVDVCEGSGQALPLTCSFQNRHVMPDGKKMIVCTLPAGSCPVQSIEHQSDGATFIRCVEPHSVLVDWQSVELENLPTHAVKQFMTADPVTVRSSTNVRTLALMMIDAHIHRLIVVDEEYRPVGIVSSSDILAAVAYAESDHKTAPSAGPPHHVERFASCS